MAELGVNLDRVPQQTQPSPVFNYTNLREVMYRAGIGIEALVEEIKELENITVSGAVSQRLFEGTIDFDVAEISHAIDNTDHPWTGFDSLEFFVKDEEGWQHSSVSVDFLTFGLVIKRSEDVPGSDVGLNGDFRYVDDGRYWKKENGAWVLQGDATASDDASIHLVEVGSGLSPATTLGENGDIAYAPDGRYWSKVGGVWLYQGDLDRDRGKSAVADSVAGEDLGAEQVTLGIEGLGVGYQNPHRVLIQGREVLDEREIIVVGVNYPGGGRTGVAGPQGDVGAAGAPGGEIHTGEVEADMAPGSDVGVNGDIFVADDGRWWNKNAGIWVFRGDLTGPAGQDGTMIHTGQVAEGGAPPDATGSDGDAFIADDGRWWEKVSGAWVFQSDLTGPAGATVHTGEVALDSAPANTVGSDGDIFIAHDGRWWEKVNGAWVYQSDLTGPAGVAGVAGAEIHTGEIDADAEPGADVGVDGDVFVADDGRWWQKQGGLWALQGDLTGTPGSEILTGVIAFAEVPDATLGNDGDVFLANDGRYWKKEGGAWVYVTTLVRDPVEYFPFVYAFRYNNRNSVSADTSGSYLFYRTLVIGENSFPQQIATETIDWSEVDCIEVNTVTADGHQSLNAFSSLELGGDDTLIAIRHGEGSGINQIIFKVTGGVVQTTQTFSSIKFNIERVVDSSLERGTPTDIQPGFTIGEDIYLLFPELTADDRFVPYRTAEQYVVHITATVANALADIDDTDDWPDVAVVAADRATRGVNRAADIVTLVRGSQVWTRTWDSSSDKWVHYNGHIGGNLLVTGGVIADHIATNAVTAAKIDAAAITTEKLAADAVTAEKIEAGTITAESGILEDASIANLKVIDSLITSRKLGSFITSDNFSAGEEGWILNRRTGRVEFNRGPYIHGKNMLQYLYDTVLTAFRSNVNTALATLPRRETFVVHLNKVIADHDDTGDQIELARITIPAGAKDMVKFSGGVNAKRVISGGQDFGFDLAVRRGSSTGTLVAGGFVTIDVSVSVNFSFSFTLTDNSPPSAETDYILYFRIPTSGDSDGLNGNDIEINAASIFIAESTRSSPPIVTLPSTGVSTIYNRLSEQTIMPAAAAGNVGSTLSNIVIPNSAVRAELHGSLAANLVRSDSGSATVEQDLNPYLTVNLRKGGATLLSQTRLADIDAGGEVSFDFSVNRNALVGGTYNLRIAFFEGRGAATATLDGHSFFFADYE